MDWTQIIESETLEAKRQLPSSNKLAIEIVAFANTRGGRIVIGYDEKAKTFVGVVPSQKLEEKIANIIHDCCEPQVPFTVSYESVQNKPLLIIDIPVSTNKPHYLKSKGLAHGTYIRVGSTCRLADQETLARLIREGKHVSFDSETISRSVSLDQEKIHRFLAERKKRLGARVTQITPSLLEDLGVQTNGRETVAGCLLFHGHPQDIPELSHAYIKAACFKGTQKGTFLDQAEIDGCLADQIDNAVTFILKNIRLSGTIEGSKRIERYEYPPEIIREAIVNAVIHRDYSISGSSILLAVYDNRLEVTSPGGLAGQVTVENIQDRQYNRNPIIAKRMFEMAYFDSWGQGVDRILAWADQTRAKAPTFIDAYDQFTLRLFPENSISPSATQYEPSLSELERDVLDYVNRHGRITNREIRRTFGCTKTQAQVVLRRLRDQNLLKVYGAGRSTFYGQ
ncbi:MAG: putative DNA binding domain-containing protein [Pirellulales bacterium]|nr:putative DNA binding domain-containing protein [Pirellulales bacterium]